MPLNILIICSGIGCSSRFGGIACPIPPIDGAVAVMEIARGKKNKEGSRRKGYDDADEDLVLVGALVQEFLMSGLSFFS